MTINECFSRIQDLKDLIVLYNKLYECEGSFKKDRLLAKMKSKAQDEIETLYDHYLNMELDDSYDAQTRFNLEGI